MKAYAKNAMKEVYADRGLFWTDFLLATSIPYIVQWLLWHWVFEQRHGESIHGYQLASLLLYYAYVIAFNRLNNGYGIVEYVSRVIHTGRFAALCCKPTSFAKQRLEDFLGGSLLYYIPLVLVWTVAQILFWRGFSKSLSMLFLLVFVIFISQLLCFYLSFFFAMFCFKLYRPGFLLSLLSILQVILGGVLLPYSFWPSWLLSLMRFNPFRYAIAAPSELLTHFSWSLCAEYFLMSFGYILLLQVIICFVWPLLLRNSDLLGG